MPRAKRALATADTNARLPPNKRQAKTNPAQEDTPSNDGGAKSAEPTSATEPAPLKHVNLCNPTVTGNSNDEDEDDNSDDDDNDSTEPRFSRTAKGELQFRPAKGKISFTGEEARALFAKALKDEAEGKLVIKQLKKREQSDDKPVCGTATCKCGKPRSAGDTWPFFVTEESWAKAMELKKEQYKRNQDAFGLYFFNDFSGYGTREVIENALIRFNRIIFKDNVSPAEKWAWVCALALFLQGDMYAFMMTDDGQGCEEIVNMTGTLLLTALDMLREHDLMKPESSIENIGLIAALYMEFALGTWGAMTGDEIGWVLPVVKALDKAGIALPVGKSIKHITNSFLDEIRANIENKESEAEDSEASNMAAKPKKKSRAWKPVDDFIDDERQWKKWDWKLEWKPFYASHKGGNHHDITKMTAQEKRQHSL
ncbi:hypothetical protein BP6252_13243 [Coleophoma cylindrospora]|uniref:Uncharacterized protein n=1 Tax=Coleophoma cylindrospora TaxID=1849047 RepID=A0A3D8QAQ7_9HELO|nr:hypothetical protein BP6252_13243 [Coleophoma cylindrospora]